MTTTIGQHSDDAVAGLDFHAAAWTISPSTVTPLDRHGARGQYVEEFYLPLLGPTCIAMLRHFAAALDQVDSYRMPLHVLPQLFGLGMAHNRHSLFGRTIRRLARFGIAQVAGPTELHVKTAVPWLTAAQLTRLHRQLQVRHDRWVQQVRS
jgi:hypothetical protein